MAFHTEKKFASKKRIATRRLYFATDKRFVDKKRSDRRGLYFSISQASASPDMLGELAALDAFAQPSKKMSACHLKANARSMRIGSMLAPCAGSPSFGHRWRRKRNVHLVCAASVLIETKTATMTEAFT